MNRTLRICLAVAACFVLAALASPQLFYPLGFDQAVYAACGYAIKNGAVPIRDCFETKQMGVMLMYAIPMLFTLSPVGIHLFTLAWTAITSVVISGIGKKLFGTTTGIVAGVLYWLIYAGINYWSMNQAETFANVFLVLAFFLLWQSTQNAHRALRHAALAGVCIGITSWFKYVFVLIGLVLGICLLLSQIAKPQRAAKHIFKQAASYAVGVIVVLVLGVGYYALQPNGINALVEQLSFLRANFPLAEPLPLAGIVANLLRYLDNGADRTAGFKATVPQLVIVGAGFPFVIGLAAVAVIQHIQKNGWLMLWLLAYFVTGIVVVVWQGNYIQYHYTLLAPPLVLLSASVFSKTRTSSRILIALTFALLGLRMLPWLRDAYDNVLVQGKSPEQMYEESEQAPLFPAARYLRDKTQPTDSIAIFGDAPWLYVLADRANATRFSFVNVWIKKTNTPNYTQMVQQYADDLARNKPAYVVLTKDNYPWKNNGYIADYKKAKPVFDYVEANYLYTDEIGEFLMFKRKQPQ